MGGLPQEVVLEVFGCAGINRLVEVECRSRVAKIGQTLLKPTEWKQVLKFALREAEISRLTVVKKLDPLTIYTFRARAGVKTTDLGDEWKVGMSVVVGVVTFSCFVIFRFFHQI